MGIPSKNSFTWINVKIGPKVLCIFVGTSSELFFHEIKQKRKGLSKKCNLNSFSEALAFSQNIKNSQNHSKNSRVCSSFFAKTVKFLTKNGRILTKYSEFQAKISQLFRSFSPKQSNFQQKKQPISLQKWLNFNFLPKIVNFKLILSKDHLAYFF